jgi:hypothetical protein
VRVKKPALILGFGRVRNDGEIPDNLQSKTFMPSRGQVLEIAIWLQKHPGQGRNLVFIQKIFLSRFSVKIFKIVLHY